MRALRRRPRDPAEAATHAPLPAGPGGRSVPPVRYANDWQRRVPVLNGGPRDGPPNPPAFGASRRSRVAPLDRASPWGARDGPPKPPAFGASRRSRVAPLDRASPWGPEMAPQTPQPSERP